MTTHLHECHPKTEVCIAPSICGPVQAKPELSEACPASLSDIDQTHIDAALASSRSNNTARAYQWGWSVWTQWAADRSVQPMPATSELVAAFLADRAATLALASVHVLRAGIAAHHRAAGLDDPTAHADVQRVLEGVTRMKRDEGRGQVRAINWQEADRAATLTSEVDGSTAGLRDAALIRVMSDALLRVSEASNLNVDDLRIDDDGAGTIVVRYSKNDQEGTGYIQYLGRPTIHALRRYQAASSVASGPMFRRINKGGAVGGRLSARSIRTVIQRRAASAGIKGRVSGHSPRVGSAQSLAAAGAGLVALQVAGRWKSPYMPAYYARHQLARIGAVATLRYGAAVHETPDQ